MLVLLQDRNVVTLPLQTTHTRKNRQATFNILRRFEFESAVMRSGVVAVEQHRSKHQPAHAMLIIKGAAAVLERMVGTDRLPPNYRKVGCWQCHTIRTDNSVAMITASLKEGSDINSKGGRDE